MRINRVMIFIYNVLVLLAFVLRMTLAGPVLYGHVWLFWGLFSIFGISIVYLSYLTFFHPTPLEIVSYHINLIMRHSSEEEEEDKEYDIKNKYYLTDRFVESENFDFFYHGDCCAKINQYSHMKIKLAIGPESFNDVTMIIKTMDERYIKFHIIKDTDHPSFAFLYDWVIDQIEYSDQIEFLEMLNGHE